MNDADNILHRCIDRLMDKKEYSTAKAAENSLKPILKLDALRPLDIPHTLPFVIDGLKYRAKNYKPETQDSSKQDHFANLEGSFGRLINAPVAQDEAPGTIRIPPVQMTLSQLLRHIDLKYRKAGQTQAAAELLRRFVEAHPDWTNTPEMTLGDILKIDIQEAG